MKPFTLIAIVVLSLVSILHLIRLVLGWEVLIAGVTIPLWISGAGFILAGGLAAMLWRESHA
jgi:hypothetical protein